MVQEFHHGLRFIRKPKGVGALEILDSNTVGMVVTAPDADPAVKRNEPFMVTAADTELRQKLGLTGTAKKHLDIIFNGTPGAVVILVVVDEGADGDATLANVIGDSNSHSGLWGLEAAPSLGLKPPKILLAPGFTHYRKDNAANPAAIAMGLLSKKLGSVHISSAPGTTDGDAQAYRADFDDENMIIVDPFVKTAGGTMTCESMVAAIGVKSDHEVGFHASWGNNIMPGCLGINRMIPYHLTNSDSRANLLMSNQINTVVNIHGGWRLWGDYAATSDTSKRFYCQTRAYNIINEAIAAQVWRIISNPLTKDPIISIIDRVNGLFDRLKKDGQSLGGRATLPPDRNSVDQLELGDIVIEHDLYTPPPITGVTFEHDPNPSYLRTTVREVLENLKYVEAM